MRKGDYCISHIDSMLDNECIGKKRYSELKAWGLFREKYSEVSPLSEDACKPLMREQNEEVRAKAIEAVGKNIMHGNIATAKQVEQLIENKRAGVKPGGRVQNHMGAVKPKDLSGIYIPPAPPSVQEVKEDEDEDNYDEEYEYKNGEADAEENDSMGDIEVMPEMDEDPVGDIPERHEPDTPEELPVAYKRNEEEKEEEEEETDNNQESEEDAKAKEAERLEMLNKMEQRRADVEAGKIVVTCLKSILSKKYPKQRLSWLVENALREVLIPDGGCPMPDSSVTKGGAITTNLGGR